MTVVGGERQVILRIYVQARVGQHEVHAPLAAEQEWLIGLIDELGQPNVRVDLRLLETSPSGKKQVIAAGVLESAVAIDLNLPLDVPAGPRGRRPIQKAGEAKVSRRQVIGLRRRDHDQARPRNQKPCNLLSHYEALVQGSL